MKTLRYALLLVIVSFFSCSVEEVDQIETTVSFIDLNAVDSKSRNSALYNASKCFREPFIDSKGNRLGWLKFYATDDDIKVLFELSSTYKFKETRLSLEAWSLEEANSINNQAPQPKDFPYVKHHEEAHTVTKYIENVDKITLGKYSRYSAFAIVTDPKGSEYRIWAGAWASYLLADFGNCTSWQTIRTTSDVDFFAPLTADSSGEFPTSGNHSDTVTLTPDNSFTEGYVDIELRFTDIPFGFKNATLSIDFIDLDLHHDIITAGGNMIDFHETFMLLDHEKKPLYLLDDSSEEDGNFKWTHDLPEHMNFGEEVVFYARVKSSLMLMEGNGITATNTVEHMKNIRLKGDVIIK